MEKKLKEQESKEKKAKKAVLTATTAASLLVNNTYDTVSDILQNDEESIDPVIREYEQAKAKLTAKEKLRGWFDSLPYLVRLLVLVPLWGIGWALMLLIRPLWNNILNPLVSKVGYWLVILLIVFAIMAMAKAILFPQVKMKDFFNRKTIIATLLSIGLLAAADELLSRTTSDYARIGPFIRFFGCLVIMALIISVFYYRHRKTIVTAYTEDLQFTASN